MLQSSCINSYPHLHSSNFSFNYEIQNASLTGKLAYLKGQGSVYLIAFRNVVDYTI